MILTKATRGIVNKKWKHGEHDVKWNLFNVKGSFDVTKRVENLRKIEGGNYGAGVCYSQLRPDVSSKFYTHLITDIPLDDYPRKTLKKEEMLRWLTLSKKNKTLPSYLSVKKVVGNCHSLNATFKLRTIANMPHLYVYLATLRYIKEDPGLVKIVLHLVEKLGIDYFVAMSIGTYHAARRKGHNIMSYDVPYPEAGKAQDVIYNITESRALKLFVSDPKKYYKTKLVGGEMWAMHTVLRALSGQKAESTFEDLDNAKTREFMSLEDI